MLPAHLHMLVAVGCLQYGKHLLTASYINPEINALHEAAKLKELIFLCECGLDPGIDHMSAMQVINRIKAEGGEVVSFKSFCGGLVAPQAEGDNPWKYKFTWSPRNVVLAGQGVSQYLEGGQSKYVPYWQLFRQVTPVQIPDYGSFESYPNRNSIAYQEIYGLQQAKTIVRGTLRRTGFCAAWHVLVQLGLTDDTYEINVKNKTYAEFISSFLPPGRKSLLERLAYYTGLPAHAEPLQKVQWLGLLTDTPIGLEKATPARVLQNLLEKKWKTQSGDQDLIVMQHQFKYRQNGKYKELHASMAVEGETDGTTGMAKTVGLPLGMAARLVLEDKIPQRGVILPIYPEIYVPVLSELSGMNVKFVETPVDTATIADNKLF
jgi:saccharopine dehydrogenase-like NADP-dependent oxidoreductase